MSNNCTRSIQQQRVFWEVLSSHVVPPGWSHCWWCRLCQELHPLEAPGHLPHLGAAISSVPLPAVCWFGIGQVMSCAPAPLGTHCTVATGCWAPSQQTWTFATMALWWHLEKAIPFLKAMYIKSIQLVADFCLLNELVSLDNKEPSSTSKILMLNSCNLFLVKHEQFSLLIFLFFCDLKKKVEAGGSGTKFKLNIYLSSVIENQL